MVIEREQKQCERRRAKPFKKESGRGGAKLYSDASGLNALHELKAA
jgi:hypothetical protein